VTSKAPFTTPTTSRLKTRFGDLEVYTVEGCGELRLPDELVVDGKLELRPYHARSVLGSRTVVHGELVVSPGKREGGLYLPEDLEVGGFINVTNPSGVVVPDRLREKVLVTTGHFGHPSSREGMRDRARELVCAWPYYDPFAAIWVTRPWTTRTRLRPRECSSRSFFVLAQGVRHRHGRFRHHPQPALAPDLGGSGGRLLGSLSCATGRTCRSNLQDSGAGRRRMALVNDRRGIRHLSSWHRVRLRGDPAASSAGGRSGLARGHSGHRSRAPGSCRASYQRLCRSEGSLRASCLPSFFLISRLLRHLGAATCGFMGSSPRPRAGPRQAAFYPFRSPGFYGSRLWPTP